MSTWGNMPHHAHGYAAKFVAERDRVGLNPTDDALTAAFANCVLVPPAHTYDIIREQIAWMTVKEMEATAGIPDDAAAQ